MERLTRAELQARNRARVLTAAHDEFTERGFRDAKVDAIADRAGLTRGAVYSNFPGKRALYFSVLADLAEREAEPDGMRRSSPRPARHTTPRRWARTRPARRSARSPAPGSPGFRWPPTVRPGSAWTSCRRCSPTSGSASRSRSS
ncbi:hypothetical protein GCM10027612_49470 [Microbispora bryophytorum subsp. camponoti]